MPYTDTMRTVLVNQKPVRVGEYATGREILESANINPDNRDLVCDQDDIVEMVPKNSRIRTHDGQSFDSQIRSRGGK